MNQNSDFINIVKSIEETCTRDNMILDSEYVIARALTLVTFIHAQYRDTFIDDNGKRWCVNGKVKRWKKDPARFSIPVKHGLYTYGYIDNNNWFCFEKES